MLPNDTVANGHGRFSTLARWMHERIEEAKAAEPPRLRAFQSKATEYVKAHPIATAAMAVAVGYAIVRMVRR